MTRLRFSVAVVFVSIACGDDGSSSSGEATSGDSSSSSSSESSASSTSMPTTSGATESSSSSGSSSGGSGLLDVYELEGDMLFPEGVAFDPLGQAFFVGSLEDGSIHRITAEGEQSMFAAGPDGSWSTAGLKVDAERGRVWACSRELDGAMVQAIWVLDLENGDVIEVVDLADSAEGAGCNDVALDAMGVAYVSDPPLGVVHRVESGSAPQVWAMDAEFAPLAGLGLNGLAITPDGAYLVLAKFLPATLYRIAIADPTDIVAIDLSGDAFVGGTPTSGADGIVFGGDALYVTFADHVKRVDLEADFGAGTVTDLEVPGAGDGLSTATEANGSIYAVKSEVTAWVLGQEPELPFAIIRVP
jgi:sugar lactone lactonase YvrE